MTKQTLVLFALIFTMLTSMTNCEKMEGPVTTVKGSITDYTTKLGYGNITLQVTRKNFTWGGNHYSDQDTVVTNSEGQYELTFTPETAGEFFIDYKDANYGKNYSVSVDSGSKELKLGATNIVNFEVRKLVNLRLNLKNNSTEIRNSWSFYIGSGGLFRFTTLNPHTKDTTLYLQASRLENAVLSSTLYNEGIIGSEIKIESQIHVGEIDTVVEMIHK